MHRDIPQHNSFRFFAINPGFFIHASARGNNLISLLINRNYAKGIAVRVSPVFPLHVLSATFFAEGRFEQLVNLRVVASLGNLKPKLVVVGRPLSLLLKLSDGRLQLFV